MVAAMIRTWFICSMNIVDVSMFFMLIMLGVVAILLAYNIIANSLVLIMRLHMKMSQ